MDERNCSASKAGNNKRSSAAGDKFDETSLFECMCAWHDIPTAFANIIQSDEK